MDYKEPHLTLSSSNPQEEEDDVAGGYALDICLSYILPMVMNAAIELQLFDIISQSGPAAQLSPSEIASQIPTTKQINNPPDNSPPPPPPVSMLDRMLQLLATHSLLTCSVRSREEVGVSERLYGLAPAGKFFVENGCTSIGCQYSSLASLVRMSFHPACRKTWFNLKDAVIGGQTPFQSAHGMPQYQYMGIDPTLNDVFIRSMVARSTIIMEKVLKIYRGFEGVTSLVDVGGGIGKVLNMIVSTYSSIKGINFDLPHVIATAPPYPGIDHIEGDMFASIPKGDAVMLKNILHNWGDEQCLILLKNCYDAVPKNGKVIIIECVKQDDAKSSLTAKYATKLDNLMLMYYGEGKVRSEKEFKALCKSSRFSDYQIVCSAYPIRVIEFHK